MTPLRTLFGRSHCCSARNSTVFCHLTHFKLCKMVVSANLSSYSNTDMSSWYNSLPSCFGIDGRNVEVISEPRDMYSTLLKLIQSSKKRILLASLYLGCGSLETDLVCKLKETLMLRPELHAHVLLDHCRGSRGANNSRTLLLPCLTDHPDRMILSLYHTPNLRGVMKTFLPDRFNELLGLQHMKVYIFDDTLMLSGANLSNDYFTNRQDRCVVIRNCKKLCDYYCSLIKVVSEFSYQVNRNNEAQLHDKCVGDPSRFLASAKFIKHATSQMDRFLNDNAVKESCCNDPDTWVYPLIQMGSFNVNDDYEAMKKFLVYTKPSDTTYLSTAYFNLPSQYTQLISHRSPSAFHILTASPQANGFTQANGVMRFIPMAYRWYERSFLRHIMRNCQAERVKLYEYSRDDWTFHSKGLWYYPAHSNFPTMTMIGSSNYGHRSIQRDLETQVVISTTNSDLKSKLHLEKESLYSRSALVDSASIAEIDRSVPLWTRIVARLCRYLF